MKTLIKAGLVILVIAFLVLFVRDSQLNQQQLELKSIEIKDTSLELKQLNQKYDQELKKGEVNQKQLEQLQKEKQDLQSQLQAKKAQEAKLAIKPIEKPVYAVSGISAKDFIYQKESGNNPGAINKSSGACGLGQALPCSKMGCSLSDYACQDTFFTNYMLNRYGSWENARAFWLSHKWW